MRALIDAIEQGALGPIRNILHVGIGGSALGPDLLVDALGRDETRYEVAIVSNVDGVALEDAFKRFDPTATLLAVASKTFTTTETMLNAESVIEWMQAGGVEDPYGRVVALTASPDKAIEWGVDETRVLPFADTVGGRYSLWSSIGFPAAIALGWDAFSELLEGAAEMDRHFRLTALHENVPALAAFADLLYTQVLRLRDARRVLLRRAAAAAAVLPPAARDGIERQGRDDSTASPSAARPRRSPGAGSAPTRSMRCSSCSIRARIWSRSN